MIRISIKDNADTLFATLDDVARKQVPFATAKALTRLVRELQAAEQKNMHQELDRPTPFTVKSVGSKGATKANLQAKVFLKDIAAEYLDPFEFGGKHKLVAHDRTWLNPKAPNLLNQYGNLPKARIEKLIARPDVFVSKRSAGGQVKLGKGSGLVKTREGFIGAVWQRGNWVRGRRVSKRGVAGKAQKVRRLKLLLRFGDALQVNQHLGWAEVAEALVKARANAVLVEELAAALATARKK